jgi:hypothetical protein
MLVSVREHGHGAEKYGHQTHKKSDERISPICKEGKQRGEKEDKPAVQIQVANNVLQFVCFRSIKEENNEENVGNENQAEHSLCRLIGPSVDTHGSLTQSSGISSGIRHFFP